MTPPILSLSHLSALHLAPPELIDCAASGGFGAVGVRVAHTERDRGFCLPAGSALLRETKSALAHNGMRVLDVEVVKLHPGSSKGDWSSILDAGAELGARHLLVTVLDDERNRAADNFGEISELSEDVGLRCCLEPMIFSSIRDFCAAADFVAAARGSNGGVLVDALHWVRAGSALSDLDAVDENSLPYWQICDAMSAEPWDDLNAAITEARTDRLPPGQGAFPLVDLVRALPPTAAVSVEVPSARSAGDTRAWIVELGRATRKVLDEAESEKLET